MARTAGAVSNTAISLGDLFRVLGMECPEIAKDRKIVISAKWLALQLKPCDMVTITQDDLDRLNNGTAAPVVPIETSRATFTPAAPARSGMDEVPDLDTLLG